jgi:hypothetical protein
MNEDIGKGRRKLFRMGEGSYVVTVPRRFIESHSLKGGEVLDVRFNDSLEYLVPHKSDIVVRFEHMKEEILNSDKIPIDKIAELDKSTDIKGVYLIANKERMLYIGSTKDIRGRIMTHQTQLVLPPDCYLQFIEIEDSEERTYFEYFLISVLHPKLNERKKRDLHKRTEEMENNVSEEGKEIEHKTI